MRRTASRQASSSVTSRSRASTVAPPSRSCAASSSSRSTAAGTDRDGGPGLGQGDGGRLADPRRRAGHQRHLAGQRAGGVGHASLPPRAAGRGAPPSLPRAAHAGALRTRASVTPKPWTARRNSTGPGPQQVAHPRRRRPPPASASRARSRPVRAAGPRAGRAAFAHTFRRDSRRKSRLACRLAGASARSTTVRRPPASSQGVVLLGDPGGQDGVDPLVVAATQRRAGPSRRTPPAGSRGPGTAAGRS